MRTANRTFRKALGRKARNGARPIRVYGNQATGFKLLDEKTQVILGPVNGFPKQKDAVAYGQARFGIAPRKIVKLAS